MDNHLRHQQPLLNPYQMPCVLLTTLCQSFVTCNVYVKIQILMGGGARGSRCCVSGKSPAMLRRLVKGLSFE